MANLDPIPYADDVEAPPSDEGDDIRQVIEALEKILALSRERSGRFQGEVPLRHSSGLLLPELDLRQATAGFVAVREHDANCQSRYGFKTHGIDGASGRFSW